MQSFIQRKVPNNVTFLLVPWLQCLCLLWAMICSFSRITDHRHHWWDVLAGFVLGAIMAIFTVSLSNHNLGNVQCEKSFLKHSIDEYSQKWFPSIRILVIDVCVLMVIKSVRYNETACFFVHVRIHVYSSCEYIYFLTVADFKDT